MALALSMLVSCANMAFADDIMPDTTPELTPAPTDEPTSAPEADNDSEDEDKEEKEEKEGVKEASKEEQLSWPAEATPYDFYTGYSESRDRLIDTALTQVTVGNKDGKDTPKKFIKGKLNPYEQWLADNYPNYVREYDISGWNTLFLCWCAAQAGLVTDGHFPITLTADDLEFYFVIHGHLENDIEEYVNKATEARRFSAGDILFWPIIDEDDFVIGRRSGLITCADDEHIEVVTGDMDNEVVLQAYKLQDICSREALVGASVVEVKYQTVAESCFNYFMTELGLNEAASCGILANVLAESMFSPEKIGDNGYSIGLFQWQDSRRLAMTAYSEAYGLNPEQVESQLIYFSYELRTMFPKTYAYLKSVENTPHGAASAADVFCRNFEAPFNRYWNGKQRALTAEETLWPIFKYRAIY